MTNKYKWKQAGNQLVYILDSPSACARLSESEITSMKTLMKKFYELADEKTIRVQDMTEEQYEQYLDEVLDYDLAESLEEKVEAAYQGKTEGVTLSKRLASEIAEEIRMLQKELYVFLADVKIETSN